MTRIFFLIFIFVLSSTASARMYQWLDPDSNTTQLSGKPPNWYRTNIPGPRVIVFDNGQVVDDTDIPVTEETRNNLRSDALAIVAADREKERERLLQEEVLKAQRAATANKEPAPEEVQPEKTTQDQTKDIPEPVAENQQETIDQMKKIIENWENQQSEKAKETLKSGY